MASAAFAADPGQPFPAASELSDQKAGSVLIYPFYISSTAAPNQNNTKMTITNTSSTSAAFVHLYFVDGQTCTVADRFMCLTANQTASFNAFDEDPGVRGYLVAVAVDGVIGCPWSHNFLIGDEFIKTGGTHQANLGAEAFAALFVGTIPNTPPCGTAATTTLAFNGVQYNMGGKVLAVASIPSFLDSNDTRLIVVRVGGDLVTGGSGRSTGTLFGLLFNDAEDGFSFSVPGSCQVFERLRNGFPRTVPPFTEVIPQNQTGWMKFWPTNPEIAVVGAVLNYNPNAATSSSAFTGGHNLHKLTLASDTATMPIFPPTC
jgi:hypothetical protein